LHDALALEALGWDAAWASELERLGDHNLIPGRIAAQHRGAYVLWTERGELRAEVSGRLRYALAPVHGLPTVGDWVGAAADPSSDRAVVHAVLPRRSSFARKEALKEAVAQTLAANVDTAFLVNGLDDDFSVRRLERYLTAAWESGATPVVVLTKADLHDDPSRLVLEVEQVAVGADVLVVSNVTGDGVDSLAPHLLPGSTAVLLGSSGVGKSSLLNRLAGRELMRTAALAADGTGRHTTTHRELIRLPDGALVIDTPGLRELQLWEGDLDSSFGDVEELSANCRFNDCSHTHEPGCDVLAAVDDGRLELDRLRSWRKLQRELTAIAARKDRRLHAELKRRWQQQMREGKARAIEKRARR
jgi:ribosome biogenesis GTPase / thiamine phosphate phosphatase